MQLSVEEHASQEDIEQVHHGLDAFNRTFVTDDEQRQLSVLLRDTDGTVVAGAIGNTYWGWLWIGTLWVDERLRGQDWGTRLVQAAEDEARQRGCHHVYLSTMSFQALPFYVKQGYTVYGTLHDKPRGHSQYFLQKPL